MSRHGADWLQAAEGGWGERKAAWLRMKTQPGVLRKLGEGTGSPNCLASLAAP